MNGSRFAINLCATGATVATINVNGTTWTIKHVNDLRVIGDEDADDRIVIDTSTRRILCPPSYDMAHLGRAVHAVIFGNTEE